MNAIKLAVLGLATVGLMTSNPMSAFAQTCNQPPPGDQADGNGASPTLGTRATFLSPPPPDYIIGADDILHVDFWGDETVSGDVVVRPDGKISVRLLNDIQAAGLTPVELCVAITEAARKYLEQPVVSVTVKQINSRKVYIVGMIGKPGPYNTTGPLTVLQLIAMAGGLHEFADKKNILVLRTEAGKTLHYTVNYEDLSKGRNLGQNIELKPGDTVIVR